MKYLIIILLLFSCSPKVTSIEREKKKQEEKKMVNRAILVNVFALVFYFTFIDDDNKDK